MIAHMCIWNTVKLIHTEFRSLRMTHNFKIFCFDVGENQKKNTTEMPLTSLQLNQVINGISYSRMINQAKNQTKQMKKQILAGLLNLSKPYSTFLS